MKFLGDALLVIFPVECNQRVDVKSATVLMASLCGLKLVKECGNYDEGVGRNKVTLRLHCGVGCGLVHCMCMGVDDRWEFVVSGEPLSQIGIALDGASAGEVCLSEEAYDLIKDKLETKKLSQGRHLLTGRRTPPVFGTTTRLYRQSSMSKQLLKASLPSPRQTTQFTSTESEASNSSPAALLSYKSMSYRGNFNDFGGGGGSNHNNNNNVQSTPRNVSEKLKATTSRDLDADDSYKRRRLSSALLSMLPFNPRRASRFLSGDGYVTPRNADGTAIDQMGVGGGGYVYASTKDGLNGSGDDDMDHGKVEDMPSSARRSLAQVGKVLSYRFTEHERDPFPLLEKNVCVKKVLSFLEGYLDTSTSGENSSSAKYHIAIAENSKSLFSEKDLEAVLKKFVHHAARPALETAGAFQGLFELRNITTVFVDIVGLDEFFGEECMFQRPQEALEVCLRSLNSFGGSLRQYTVDDKGWVLIGAFGLPGSSHEDNSRRAVEAAVSIRQGLEAAGIGSKAGIAEGRVFCGLVGSGDRCEYAMMGASVNLAARLMGKCQPGDILVSETVFLSSQSSFYFTLEPMMQAKGYSNLVKVFKFKEKAYGKVLLGESSTENVRFVGRKEEVKLLSEALAAAKESRSASRYIVSGPPSLGKTRLVAEALRVATELRKEPVRVAASSGSAAYINSYNYIIRQLLDQVMNLNLETRLSKDNMLHFAKYQGNGIMTKILNWTELHNLKNPYLELSAIEKSFHKVTTVSNHHLLLPRQLSSFKSVKNDELIDNNYNIEDIIPLLGDILDVKMKESEFSRSLSGKENRLKRRRLTDALALKLLQVGIESEVCSDGFDAYLVDNLQWCDSNSSAILLALTSTLTRGVFIGIARPDPHIRSDIVPRPTFLSHMTKLCEVIQPPPLAASEIQLIVENVFGPRNLLNFPIAVSRNTIEVIMNRAGGSPFHVSVLASRMKTAFLSGKHLGVKELPGGADNLTISRYDTLNKTEQFVIKVASVISVVGLMFNTRSLIYVISNLRNKQENELFHTDSSNVESLVTNSLQALVNVSLLMMVESTKNDATQNDDLYKFADFSVQESIYNLMLEQYRKGVHSIYAKYLESIYGVFDSLDESARNHDQPQEDVITKVNSSEGQVHQRRRSMSCYRPDPDELETVQPHSSADKLNKFEEVVTHYSRSSVDPKKIYYLQKAADMARKAHAYDDLCRHSDMLIKLSTGITCDELLSRRLTSIHHRNSSKLMHKLLFNCYGSFSGSNLSIINKNINQFNHGNDNMMNSKSGHVGNANMNNHNATTSIDATTGNNELPANTPAASRKWLTMNDFRHHSLIKQRDNVMVGAHQHRRASDPKKSYSKNAVMNSCDSQEVEEEELLTGGVSPEMLNNFVCDIAWSQFK